eukprot:3107835-Rhodomonas_salina.1
MRRTFAVDWTDRATQTRTQDLQRSARGDGDQDDEAEHGPDCTDGAAVRKELARRTHAEGHGYALA